jgi:hypothetical protein
VSVTVDDELWATWDARLRRIKRIAEAIQRSQDG